MTNITTINQIYVTQDATAQYTIHQYKNFVDNGISNNISWYGMSNLAPSDSTVYLQIFNTNSSSWETVASKSTGPAYIEFYLNYTITPLTNYKDASNVVTCRVYQHGF